MAKNSVKKNIFTAQVRIVTLVDVEVEADSRAALAKQFGEVL